MPVFHLNSLPKEKRIQMIGEFYDAIDSLKDRNEVRLFLKSLLTAEEIAMFMRRIEIAILLSGDVNYMGISKMLGVGNGKISAVQRALQQDDNGYKIIVERLIENRKKRLKKIKKEEKNARESSAIKKFSAANRILPDLLDAVIESMEEDKDLEKEALLFTPSRAPFSNKTKK
jgi:TrpR-related protein YerC/YecD